MILELKKSTCMIEMLSSKEPVKKMLKIRKKLKLKKIHHL